MKLPRTSWPVDQNTWDNLVKIINGQISLGSSESGTDNIDLAWLTTTSPAVADTEFTLDHNLGRVPSGFMVVSIDQAGIAYKGATAWTTTQLSLKCNVAAANIVLIVV